MTTTTAKTQGVGEAGYDDLDDAQIDLLLEGAPDTFGQPTGEGPVIEHQDVSPEPTILAAPAGKVILRNIRYINETLFIPVNGEIHSGSKVQFTDGTLITDRDTAEFVKATLPYVREEPSEGAIFTYKGFQTRDPYIYEQYVQYYNENVAG